MGIIENTLGACLARLFVKKGGQSLEKQISWSRLDNTAKLFPAISGEHAANVFRLWADLEEDIHPKGASGSGGTSFEGPSGLCS